MMPCSDGASACVYWVVRDVTSPNFNAAQAGSGALNSPELMAGSGPAAFTTKADMS